MRGNGWSEASRARAGKACAVLVIAACAGILLSACGSSDSTSSGTGGGSETSGSSGGSWAQAQAAAKARAERFEHPIESLDLKLPPIPDGASVLAHKKILVVPLASAIFASMQASITKGIEAAGGNVRVCDGKANPTEIGTCLASAKTSNVDAVITIAVSPDIAGEGYRELEAEHIPTYAAWQNPLQTPETELLRFQDNVPALESSLKTATDYAMATSEEPLQSLLIGNQDSKPTEAASKNWMAYTEEVCTGCSQNTDFVITTQASQVTGMVSSQLIQHPETNTVMTFNIDVYGPPAVEGLANSAEKPRLGGNGSGGPALKLIQQGRLSFDVATSLYYEGWAAVDGLMRQLAGLQAVEYPAAIRIFDPENVSELNLAPQNETSFQWFGNAPIEAEFEKAWGL